MLKPFSDRPEENYCRTRNAATRIAAIGELFCRRNRGKISVAVDGFLAEMFPATEQKYGKGNRNQSTQDGTQASARFTVVRHGHLR
jgi:hypothetical protein